MSIIQTTLPFAPWLDPKYRGLPGVQPLAPDDWLSIDDAYTAQMAERARLLLEQREKVLAVQPSAKAAAQELYELVCAELPRLGFARDGAEWRRPDGRRFADDATRPLWSLGHLLQADFCILQKPVGEEEHRLTAAVLCFPANWTLAEKLGHPLGRVHAPVPDYDDMIARRVQRLFDAIRPEQPLWRANLLLTDDPALFLPRPEAASRPVRPFGTWRTARYLRTERQTLRRLPQTRAVVFAIHTVIIRTKDLTAAQKDALDAMAAG